MSHRSIRRAALALAVLAALAVGCTVPASPAPLARHAIDRAVPLHYFAPRQAGLLPDAEWAGDSLSAGWYATYQAETFPALVESHWGLGDLQVPGTGPGYTAVQLSAAFANGQTSVQPADLIVVELGTNDDSQNVPYATFDSAYANIVWSIHQEAPASQLVCLGIYNLESTVNAVGVSGKQYDQSIAYRCGLEGGIYISLQPYTADHGPAGRTTWLGPGDNWHPNTDGHAGIAWAIICHLSSNVCEG